MFYPVCQRVPPVKTHRYDSLILLYRVVRDWCIDVVKGL